MIITGSAIGEGAEDCELGETGDVAGGNGADDDESAAGSKIPVCTFGPDVVYMGNSTTTNITQEFGYVQISVFDGDVYP